MCLEIKQQIITEPSYYYREYDNDLPGTCCKNSWLEQAKKVSLVTLPFFSLYKPFSFPLSLALGGIRVISCSSELIHNVLEGNLSAIALSSLQTSIAIVAFAGTIFAHPLGMIITTAQDILIETLHLIQHLQNGDYKKGIVSCLSIINNALYLTLFLKGGIAITIASLAMQILMGLIHSFDNFQKGHYLEGTGHLLMCMVRGKQLASRVNTLQKIHRFEKLTSTFISNNSHEKKSFANPIKEDIKHTIKENIKNSIKKEIMNELDLRNTPKKRDQPSEINPHHNMTFSH